jgi:hypothetical protein
VDWLPLSIAAKLSRAEYHLGILEQTVESGAVTDLVETRTDRDRHGRVRIRVKETREMLPEWHVWIGECVHDMRSALDHLAYGLNIIGSRQDPPPNWEHSQFPIYSKRLNYRGGKWSKGKPAKKLVACFPPGARTCIEGLQPYRGREHDPFTNRRLSDLAELSNIDKHRRFPITAAAPKRYVRPTQVEGHRVGPVSDQYRLLKPDTTIIWLEVPTLPRTVKQPNVDFEFTANIELVGRSANPPIALLVPSEPVTFALGTILRFIRERVLPEFDRWVPDLSTVSRGHV